MSENSKKPPSRAELGLSDYNFGVSGQKLTVYKMPEDFPVAEIPYAEAADRLLTAPETAAQRDRLLEVNKELVEALKITQWGFNHRRCPVCAGWNVGPNGETDHVHTKDCPVGAAISKARGV